MCVVEGGITQREKNWRNLKAEASSRKTEWTYIKLEIYFKTYVSFGSVTFTHKDFISGIVRNICANTKREDITGPSYQEKR